MASEPARSARSRQRSPRYERGQVDGIMASVESGYGLQEKGQGKLLIAMAKYAPHFITHVIFARKDLVTDNPDLVARFLKGFFASVAFEKANKDKDRRDRDVRRRRAFRSGGDRRDQGFSRRHGHAAGETRGQSALHDTVHAGETVRISIQLEMSGSGAL
jgi:hypothetical protein